MNYCEKRWAVVGFDYETARSIMLRIALAYGKSVTCRIDSGIRIVFEFEDGTTLTWIPVSCTVHGYRCGKMWCDKNIDKEVFKTIIRPQYFGKREDIVWL